MARAKTWSYSAGRRGANRVRAFFDARDRAYYLEWREGARRCRQKLQDVDTQKEAASRADKLAAKFVELAPQERPKVMSIDHLLDLYLKERSPQKGTGRQAHDRRAAQLWRVFLGAGVNKRPEELCRTEWDAFVHTRRNGLISGYQPVRNNAIQMDLKFMIAVLGWGVGARHIQEHPWRGEIRKAQQWSTPREMSPARPHMTDELREGLIRYAPSGWQFRVALLLERETCRRNASIRRLRWADVDLVQETILWRGEFDKSGRERRTPLTTIAVELLRDIPRGIGAAPVFPAALDPSQTTPRDTWQNWLRRAKRRWLRSVEDQVEQERLRAALKRVGFHSEKRTGVRDPGLRRLMPKEQEALAGTSWEVLRDVYDDLTLDDLRDANRRRQIG